jgi:Asp-tRNA(Asn)/Glu-tRNA(Gln) amidotransferase A subunit family amidase
MSYSPYTTAREIKASIVRKEISATEVMAETLARMEALEQTLNAFVTPMPEQAMEAARAADRLLAEGGEPGPLHGIPISVKDLINVGGVRTTFGSRAMEKTSSRTTHHRSSEHARRERA